MVLYKAFYLDIITLFDEKGFINKRSYIAFNDISSIIEGNKLVKAMQNSQKRR